MKTLRLILGDQLNSQHSWFRQRSDDILYVMMEMRQETDYVTHHIQKLIGFFTAMRHFAGYLEKRGKRVVYIKLDDPGNRQSLSENLKNLIVAYDIQRLEYQEPDEYRLDKQLEEFTAQTEIEVRCETSQHFFTSRFELAELFSNKKQYLMESFYRYMRKRWAVLMTDDKHPMGGKWNFDKENRKSLPENISLPDPYLFNQNVSDLVALIKKEKINFIGEVDPGHFNWPLERSEALKLLELFIKNYLPYFGTYQDAMSTQSWSLFHSRLSFALNTKMLHPREVIDKTVQAFHTRGREISLAQVEGFIRQILGWREYMRGIYWKFMPGYESLNYFKHTRDLPQFYWTGRTRMRCMKHVIGQSLRYAYAHHIQRLMVTGNFALLTGIAPDQVDRWYLGIYIDAVQWVELPNTRGMSQYADGGMVGSKPYVYTANYINSMSDYCHGCYYDKAKKTGDRACPFNSLYWRFFALHWPKLHKNPRIALLYKTWDKMSTTTRTEIINQAEAYLSRVDEL